MSIVEEAPSDGETVVIPKVSWASTNSAETQQIRMRDLRSSTYDVDPYVDEALWRPELFTWTVKKTGAVLPEPPSSRTEKFLYAKRYFWILTLGGVVSTPLLVYSQFQFIKSESRLWLLAPVMVLTPIVFIVRLFLDRSGGDFDLPAHARVVEGWRPQRYPTVDVFLPTCGESLEVLSNTWRYVTKMQRHYPGTTTVYVLDDGARPEVATMAAEFAFRYHTRPNRGWFKKAGNLNYGLERSAGEYILILDADFVPRRDMLDETLPYFDADPKLGILQTPQYFRVTEGQTWVERGAAAVQELFYRAIQPARDQCDAVVCCGTNAVYRREALEQNGGVTLISHSEDAHTGVDLRRLGWHVRYIPVILASGLCPAEPESFFGQQYRWCVGTMSIVLHRTFWAAKMRLSARLYDVIGFIYYLETALLIFAGPIAGIALCLAAPHFVALRNFLLIAPSIIVAYMVTPLWHRTSHGTETWSVKIVYSWAHAFAIWDMLRGREMGWQVTGEQKKKASLGVRRLWLGMWVWTAPTAILSVVLAGWRMLTWNTLTFTPVFLTAVFYAYTVVRILVSKLAAPIDA